MRVEVVSRVSEVFHASVSKALESFPPYYEALDTTIALGPRLKSIFPDIKAEWRHLSMFHRGATNTIGLAEYRRIESASGRLAKNNYAAEGIAHESGHAFDLRVLGNVASREYFSLNPAQPFLAAWHMDMKRLEAAPQLVDGLHPIFRRHMKPDGSGSKETFAELWANHHGYSALRQFNIDDIRPYWPNSSAVLKECIAGL
jgi:hypothetical protein